VILAVLISGIAVIGGGAIEPTPLQRWSSPDPISGEIVALEDQGVEIRVGEEIIPITIPWYDVRSLGGDQQGFGEYKQIADDAWRAHSRLARGDYSGAESIYQMLGDAYLFEPGAQSADVSMGLVRCRLDRGDRVAALRPYLSWFVGSAFFAPRKSEDNDPPRFDSQYGLLIDLPPIFSQGDRGKMLAPIPESDRNNDRIELLARYFRLALDAGAYQTPQAGESLDELRSMSRKRENRDLGLDLFNEMLTAQIHPDSQERIVARSSLERRARANKGTWIELWARLGLGVSLIGEQDPQANERGVIELIHIIVRLDDVSHPLTLLASQVASDYLSRTDRPQWGSELMLEARAMHIEDYTSTHTKEHDAHD